MKKYECTVCGYIYNPLLGDPDSGIAPGTAFEDIPDNWVCPICGVDKSQFRALEEATTGDKSCPAPNEWMITFTERIQRTSAIASFVFATPAGLNFRAGQYAYIVFDDQNRNNRQLNKILSFSCPPGGETIHFTKRFSNSEFSARLWALKPGERIRIVGPTGDCVFYEDLNKIAFLTGGIGITPVVSIVGYIAERALPTDVYLLYSNRTENDIAYKDLLDNYAQKHPNIKLVYTCDYEKPTDSRISFGMINKDFVLKRIPDYQERTFFIVGPPGMVNAMVDICKSLGCPPERIKAENFAGY